MIVINLRIYYPALYKQDVFFEVPEQIKLLLDELKRYEHAQNERRRYHGAYWTFMEAVTESELQLPSLEEAYEKSCQLQELYRAMQRLPAKQRRRIYAHFFLQMSETEIARMERVRLHCNTGGKHHSQRLGNPMIARNLPVLSRKGMVAEGGKIVVQGGRMQFIQDG